MCTHIEMERMQTEINPFPFYTIEIDSSLFDGDQQKKRSSSINPIDNIHLAHTESHTFYGRNERLMYIDVPSHWCAHTNVYLYAHHFFFKRPRQKVQSLRWTIYYVNTAKAPLRAEYKMNTKIVFLFSAAHSLLIQTMCLHVHYFTLLIPLKLKFIYS